MKTNLMPILIALAVLAGCAERIHQPIPAANQEAALVNPPVETFPEPPLRTEGSLFTENTVNLFADAKARRVGDIVTINIVENSRASKNANTNTGRQSSIQANTNALLGYEDPTNLPLVGGAFNSLNYRPNVGVDANFASSFSGSGTTNRNENMTARISARIIQVLPNGNLVLRGSQEILVNNERQYITVQGVVRPHDITAENTVLSTYIADARIDYTGQGDLSRKQREGWLSRFFDTVWPF
jgi:flagellar L-ring protein precursor FlgH